MQLYAVAPERPRDYAGRESGVDDVYLPDYQATTLESSIDRLVSLRCIETIIPAKIAPATPMLVEYYCSHGTTTEAEWTYSTLHWRRRNELASDLEGLLTSMSDDTFSVTIGYPLHPCFARIRVVGTGENTPRLTCPRNIGGWFMHKLSGIPLAPEHIELTLGEWTVMPYVYDYNYGMDRIFALSDTLSEGTRYATTSSTLDAAVADFPRTRKATPATTSAIGWTDSSKTCWTPPAKTNDPLTYLSTKRVYEYGLDYGIPVMGRFAPLIMYEKTSHLFSMDMEDI